MTKRVKLALLACCMAPAMWAQQTQPTDTLAVDDDNADFTFTESQIDGEEEAAQAISALVSTKSDPYLADVGYLFSPMRFRVRGLDNQYNQTYLNGLNFNDTERGRFSYSMIGGLNNVVRNRDAVSAFEATTFGLPGVGGATNIGMRPTQLQQGHKLTLSGCNRNYVARLMYNYASGINAKGWAFAASLGYRWAKEGVIEGTYYNSLSYYLAAQKIIDDRNSLSLMTFGAPTERAQQGASTEEAYWLANSHYYNPNWGYQNGEKRNSRVVNDFAPTTVLTWDFDIDENTALTTSAGFKYSMYSNTALGWNGNAYDPRPDYYKNFPSSIFDVTDPEKNNAAYLTEHPYFLDQWNTLYDYWTSDKANRQINWDRMYYVNREAAATGGEALYYQERRHNDQMTLNLSSTLNRTVDLQQKYSLGVEYNFTRGMHYKTMADLLGATNYYDYDKFAANDYGRNSTEAQNDLRYPNRKIGVGDRFGYDYDIYVHKVKGWGQYIYTGGPFTLAVAGHLDGSFFERYGNMQNGRAPLNSYGRSGWAKFLGGGGRFQLAYNPNANNRIAVGAGWTGQAPLPANSFVAPRMQNNFVDDLGLEHIFSAELAWDFRFGWFSGRIAGYANKFLHGVEQTAFYNDQEQRFTYLTMNDIEKGHYGVEAALKFQATTNLSFKVIGTISDATYDNDPSAQLSYEGMDASTISGLNQWTNPVTKKVTGLKVIANGMRVNGTPLTAVSVGVDYNVNNWWFGLNLNYYDRVYVGFSQYRRLSNILTTYTSEKVTAADGTEQWQYMVTESELKENGGILVNGETGLVEKTYSPEQEKFQGGFLLDASIGKYIRLQNGRSLSINLSVNNILNNTNLRTGGYEQNRDDLYSTGEARPYKFSKNSKYYYANAFNAFLNLGYRF